MPVITILIESCEDCPFKTAYYGGSDYWICDEATKKIEEMGKVPEWCPREIDQKEVADGK